MSDDREWFEDEECPECGRRWKEADEDDKGRVSFWCKGDHRWTLKPPAPSHTDTDRHDGSATSSGVHTNADRQAITSCPADSIETATQSEDND